MNFLTHAEYMAYIRPRRYSTAIKLALARRFVEHPADVIRGVYNVTGATVRLSEKAFGHRLAAQDCVTSHTVQPFASAAYFSIQRELGAPRDPPPPAHIAAGKIVNYVLSGRSLSTHHDVTLVVPRLPTGMPVSIGELALSSTVSFGYQHAYVRYVLVRPEHGWLLARNTSMLPPDVVVLFPLVYTLGDKAYDVDAIGLLTSDYEDYDEYMRCATTEMRPNDADSLLPAVFDTELAELTEFHSKVAFHDAQRELARNIAEATKKRRKEPVTDEDDDGGL